MHRRNGTLGIPLTHIPDFLLFLPATLLHLSSWSSDTKSRLKVYQFALQSDTRHITPCHHLCMDSRIKQPLGQLIAHPAVMIRTIPFACLRRPRRWFSLLIQIFVPATIRLVNKVRLDIRPVSHCSIKETPVASQLPGIHRTDDSLTLWPPGYPRAIALRCLLVTHRPFVVKTFIECSPSHLHSLGLYPSLKVGITNDSSSFAHQPRRLDIVSVGIFLFAHSIPVVVAIENQMSPFLVVKLRTQNPQQFLQIGLQFIVGPHLIERRIGLKHMDMSIHRLRGTRMTVDTMLLSTCIIALEHLDIAQFSLIVDFRLQRLIELYGSLETPFIARRPKMLCQAIDAKGTGIGLLRGILCDTLRRQRPIHALVFPIYKMSQIILRCTIGRLAVTLKSIMAIGFRKGPQDACIQYSPFIGIVGSLTVIHHDTIETAIGVNGFLHPERQDILRQIIGNLLTQLFHLCLCLCRYTQGQSTHQYPASKTGQ